MLEIKQLFDLFTKLNHHFQNNGIYSTAISSLNQIKNQNNSASLPQIQTALNQLASELDSFDTTDLTTTQKEILEAFGFWNLLDGKMSNRIYELIRDIKTNPRSINSKISPLYIQAQSLLNRPNQIVNQLQPVTTLFSKSKIGSDDGILEITFDQGVSIENFEDAKKLMNDWFGIIDGYARVLGLQKNDFEIVSIVKASPTKIKVKTYAGALALVLSISSGILDLENRFLKNEVQVQQIKQDSIANLKAQEQYIKAVKESVQKELQDAINMIVEDKMKKYEGEDPNTVEAALKKGIEKQYNFISMGGTVNVYLNEGVSNPTQLELENKVREVKLLREELDQMKKIEQ